MPEPALSQVPVERSRPVAGSRRRELLPVPYAHGVFTLPGQPAPLALQNKSEIYGPLIRAGAVTLPAVARDERHL
jgi:hypothetical protein